VQRQWVAVERTGVILNKDAGSRRFGRHGGHGHVGDAIDVQGLATAEQLKCRRACRSRKCARVAIAWQQGVKYWKVYAQTHRPGSCWGKWLPSWLGEGDGRSIGSQCERRRAG
jgi:hypothetical protein